MTREGDGDFSGLKFTYEPMGNLDGCRAEPQGGYKLWGWAGHAIPTESIMEVQVLVNGQIVRGRAGLRPARRGCTLPGPVAGSIGLGMPAGGGRRAHSGRGRGEGGLPRWHSLMFGYDTLKALLKHYGG